MSKSWFLATTILLILSCSDTDDSLKAIAACGFDNALEELPWLKAEIKKREQSDSEEMRFCYIEQIEINGLTLFVLGDCNPAIDKHIPLINCEGSSDYVLPNGDSLVTSRQIIWKPKNFVCKFD